jgi:DNA invertase Pin-like site-specific DNA recombinase
MTPTKTVAYVRVSTEKQSEHGHSLEAQEAKLKAYAELYDLQLVELVVDAGVSAKTLNRPGLQKVLGMLKDGKAEAVLVLNLSRLTRSVRDLGELVETYFGTGKSALLSVSEQIDTRSAAGRLVLNVLASVSQWEREAIGERTRGVLQHMKAEGRRVGGKVRYGFEDVDGKLVPVESEQRVIRTAQQLRSQGRSYSWVAGKLNALGFTSRAGTGFHSSQVQKMLAA